MEQDTSLWPKVRNILVIDDDPAMSGLLKMMLSKLGYLCTIANNGVEGLELAQTLKPDAILLDLVMPEMNGYAFLRQWHFLGTPEIPVIVLSSRSRADEIQKAMTLGASGYVIKPVDVRKLAERLEMVIPGGAKAGLDSISFGDGRSVFRR